MFSRSGRAEQEGVVGHERDLVAQRRQVHVAHVHAVDEHLALVDVVEARDQHDQRALARAGGAHHGHGAARGHVQVDVAQHLGAVVVAERHAAHLDPAAAGRQRLGARGRGQLRLAVQDLEHAVARGHRALGHAQRHAEHAHRAGQHDHVAVEGHEVADGDGAVDGLAPAHQQDGRQPELGQEADEGVVEGAQPGGDHRLVEHPRDGLVEAVHLARLLREGLDHAHAAHVLLGLGRQLGDALLDLLRGGPVQAPVAGGRPDDQRHRGQRHRGQDRVHRDHHHGGDHDGQQRLHHEDQAVAQEEAHRLQVHRRARHQLAGLLAVEEAQLQRLQVAVHPVAQVELHAQRDAAGHQPAHHAEDQAQHARGHHHAAQQPQRVAALADVVDRAADQERDQHAGAHGGSRQQQRRDHAAAVGTQESQQSPKDLHTLTLLSEASLSADARPSSAA